MWPCERLDAIDSTQRELQRRLAAAGSGQKPACAPFGVWTSCQTDGMASHGRKWHDASRGLALSMAWPCASGAGHGTAWPVRLSLAVMSALEAAYPKLAHQLGVKWPNDIMHGQHKLAGVLVSRQSVAGKAWLIAGVGVNLAWSQSPPIDRPVTALQSLGIDEIDEPRLIEVVCEHITNLWSQAPDDRRWRDEFERRDVHYMRRVSVVDPFSGKLLHQGIAQGISDAGELMLRVGQTLCAIQIGEVSVRAPHDDSQSDVSAKEFLE